MSYSFHLVIRTRNEEYKCGAASEMLLRNGWTEVMSLGKWYGSQCQWRPYQKMLEYGKGEARRRNNCGAWQPHQVLVIK